ncbi:NAD-glutamate dehydrogenase domain-containing protein [Sphingosinicella sp. LY1275]|uniref:NAD-glutamate dehydrogenase domain-containing protein n=1 Tax=Sphingosinicella sp. LY1275 TaxID=3095379 RepID=UPI002ADEAADB|nr:NAD-glutamate dehydrogenase domain-containing protein [Sphingosinicella sp. LY1275]MEA1014625.1 NAD-glutamate dehydrogenase [Sphingosinicella sp. LY1275]
MSDTFDVGLIAANRITEDIQAAFSQRLGRPLTEAEQAFVGEMFDEDSIAAQSWAWMDAFEDLVVSSEGVVGNPADFIRKWGKAFGAGYQEMFGAEDALADIVAVEDMLKAGRKVAIRSYRRFDDLKSRFRFKLYHDGDAVPLADVLPILHDMGLKALVEEGFPIRPRDAGKIWVHEYLVDDPKGESLVFRHVERPFAAAFLAAWTGVTDSDGFNRLVLELGVSWRETAVLRALARYRQQTGLDPSQDVQIAALVEHPAVARLLLDLFHVRFDPATGASAEERAEGAARITSELQDALQAVPSLDADRALRRIMALINSIKRTNFYQADANGAPKPHIAFKIASQELENLPEPKPYREIFVAAPHVEGVHLRFGAVARGGLRWSDRKDDFRSEVLGLVKAQQVKNAVIVPVGAKGGFYVKGARPADPQAARAAGVAAYRTFLSAMLDVTDNIDAAGAIVPPADVVRHDEDDPYLVVAADKGTASFSDIANEVSESYGFWLGDAFASGGSAGYDHKAMGITARGAWEAVKRHFREVGKDIQSEPFTAVGVGDMSGDVFGNGMLLSKSTRLVAAFDHRDIFIDPNPDPATSWAERKRLFDLPRSSWQDYDKAKLSAGGGVYSRNAKAIELSPEAREALGLAEASLSPTDLMQAILRAPVELLYMGGIGTYVKGAEETHQQVSDKANDAVRVDGRELKAKVVGEGANLGFTQAGRIEFARTGGRINTDAIDNSGGVDSSDLEVNIKILTALVEAAGELGRADRDALLASMTDDVAENVLANNRAQTLALSLIESTAAADIGSHAALMDLLERAGRLNRRIEGLPDAAAIAELEQEGKGLTRPELAVLLAYGKLTLFEDAVKTQMPDDPHFEEVLRAYFPSGIEAHAAALEKHPLRREIIATVLVNNLVNMTGPAFPYEAMQTVGCDAGAIVSAFAMAGNLFGLDAMWRDVAGLADTVDADTQLTLYRRLADAYRHQAQRLARLDGRTSASCLSDTYGAPIRALVAAGEDALLPADVQPYREQVAAWVAAGVAQELAGKIALLPYLEGAVPAALLAREGAAPVANVALLYREMGALTGLEELRAAAATMKGGDRFERLAIARLVEQTYARQESLARQAMAKSACVDSAANAWANENAERVASARDELDQVRRAPGPWSLGRLTVAAAALTA